MTEKHDDTRFISTTITNGIQKVIIDRPRKKNAINIEMYNQLINILNESSKNKNVHTLVFFGKGDFFSSGNDFTDTLTKTPDNMLEIVTEMTMTFKKFVDTIITYRKLLIAVVNGPAIGIAATMLGLFDLIYASEKAYFHTPFSNLGLTGEGCSTYTFPRIMGTTKAAEILYLGYKMVATEAEACGFVNKVYKHDCLNDVWDKIYKISELSTQSIHLTKRLVKQWNEKKLLNVNAEEVKILLQRLTSADFVERMISVLARKSKY